MLITLIMFDMPNSEGEQAALLRLLSSAGLGPGSLALQGDVRAPGLRQMVAWGRRMMVRSDWRVL